VGGNLKLEMLKLFGEPELQLTEAEVEIRRRRQRLFLVIGAAILIFLGLGVLSARPIVNTVRAWQARRHAEKAYVLMDQEKWGDARSEAIAAYRLRPTEPEAIRAVARLLSRAGQSDGLKFWQELAAKTKLTRTDLRDQAGLALKTREFTLAETVTKELLTDRDGGPGPPEWLLAADLAMQERDPQRAMIHVRSIFGSSKASDRDLFKATFILDHILQGKETKDRAEVLERFARLASGKESIALDALVVLGQNILNSTAPWPDPAGMTIDNVIEGLEKHPLAKPQHKLLAIDLKIHEHPEQRDELLQTAIAQLKDGDNTTLLALGTWLNSRGEFQRELDTIPRQRAMQTRELFFQHVDALGALGRWDEIRRLIESEQFPLDPVVEHMYLARCFAQQGQTAGAENNWTRALQAAAGDLPKLMTLGEYAEKNGAYDVAMAAFEAAVAVSPTARPAQQGRLRVAYETRDTKKIHAILVDLSKHWPNDPAVQNDEAYIRLLLLPSAPVASEVSSQKPEGAEVGAIDLNRQTANVSDQKSDRGSELPAPSSQLPAPSPPKDGLAVASSPPPVRQGTDTPWRAPTPPNNQEPITDNSDLVAIERLAEKLVEREPTSLPHRTVLALARLKLNRPEDALSVYKDINVPKSAATTSSIAVHAAVLAACGHESEAREEFSKLPADKLLPEEQALMKDSGD
jgi:tetratricopeptide (TPR) repeat protein